MIAAKDNMGKFFRLSKRIRQFKVDYSPLHRNELIDIRREELLQAFERELLSNHYVQESDYGAGLATDFPPPIKDVITKKIKEINGKAKRQKMHLAEMMMSTECCHDYRLTRQDIEQLIERKNQKRPINCFVIDGNQPVTLSDFLDDLQLNGQARTQLIYKKANSQHWSCMDIRRDRSGKLSVFFIDALGTMENNLLDVLEYCQRARIEVTKCMGGIQKDFASCSIFATDHAFHLSKLDDFHEQILTVRRPTKDDALCYEVSALDLPPVLVKNAQSTSFIAHYLKRHPEYEATLLNSKRQTLYAYAESHHTWFQDKKYYTSIVYKQNQYRKKVNNYKGVTHDPDYYEHQRAYAQDVFDKTIKSLQGIEINYQRCYSKWAVKWYCSSLLKRIEEIRTSREVRDAQTILNLNDYPETMKHIIEQKKSIIEEGRVKQLKKIKRQSNQLLQEKEGFIQRTVLLETIQLNHYLEAFLEKANEMRDKAQTNTNYNKAFKTADELCVRLQHAKYHFLNRNINDSLVNVKRKLVIECQSALKDARPVLEEHREWAGVLKQFLMRLLSCLTIGVFHEQLTMFSRTDSVKKIDEFDDQITPYLHL